MRQIELSLQLWEESQKENGRLRDEMCKLKDDLGVTKRQLDTTKQVRGGKMKIASNDFFFGSMSFNRLLSTISVFLFLRQRRLHPAAL